MSEPYKRKLDRISNRIKNLLITGVENFWSKEFNMFAKFGIYGAKSYILSYINLSADLSGIKS